jgi:hypothetical protein
VHPFAVTTRDLEAFDALTLSFGDQFRGYLRSVRVRWLSGWLCGGLGRVVSCVEVVWWAVSCRVVSCVEEGSGFIAFVGSYHLVLCWAALLHRVLSVECRAQHIPSQFLICSPSLLPSPLLHANTTAHRGQLTLHKIAPWSQGGVFRMCPNLGGGNSSHHQGRRQQEQQQEEEQQQQEGEGDGGASSSSFLEILRGGGLLQASSEGCYSHVRPFFF